MARIPKSPTAVLNDLVSKAGTDAKVGIFAVINGRLHIVSPDHLGTLSEFFGVSLKDVEQRVTITKGIAAISKPAPSPTGGTVAKPITGQTATVTWTDEAGGPVPLEERVSCPGCGSYDVKQTGKAIGDHGEFHCDNCGNYFVAKLPTQPKGEPVSDSMNLGEAKGRMVWLQRDFPTHERVYVKGMVGTIIGKNHGWIVQIEGRGMSTFKAKLRNVRSEDIRLVPFGEDVE